MLPITCLVRYLTQTRKALRYMLLILSLAMMCSLSTLSKLLTPVRPQNFAFWCAKSCTLHGRANAYMCSAASPCQPGHEQYTGCTLFGVKPNA